MCPLCEEPFKRLDHHLSSNPITNLSSVLALHGSGSCVSNSLTSIRSLLSIPRTDIVHINNAQVKTIFFNHALNNMNPLLAAYALLIIDLVDLRSNSFCIDADWIDREECN